METEVATARRGPARVGAADPDLQAETGIESLELNQALATLVRLCEAMEEAMGGPARSSPGENPRLAEQPLPPDAYLG